MVTAGDYLHLRQYKNPISYGYKKVKDSKSNEQPKEQFNEQPKDKNISSTENQKTDSNLYRTRKQVRLLLQSNIDIKTSPYKSQFVTYTFRKNIINFREANKLFSDFTLRLNWHLKTKLKYLVVSEIQPKRFKKYGVKVWHFHVIYFNLPKIWYPRLYKIWKHGSIKVKPMNNLKHLINYISKYFTKQKIEDYFENQKKFFTSRGLKKPFEIRDENLVEEIKKKLSEPKFKKTFDPYINLHTKKEQQVTYSLYELNQEQKALLQSIQNLL